MKPIKFKEQNITFAENQTEYMPLPAFKNDSTEGEVISCWKLSWKERFQIFFTGRLWVCLLSFNAPLTPSFFTVFKKEILKTNKGPLMKKL